MAPLKTMVNTQRLKPDHPTYKHLLDLDEEYSAIKRADVDAWYKANPGANREVDYLMGLDAPYKEKFAEDLFEQILKEAGVYEQVLEKVSGLQGIDRALAKRKLSNVIDYNQEFEKIKAHVDSLGSDDDRLQFLNQTTEAIQNTALKKLQSKHGWDQVPNKNGKMESAWVNAIDTDEEMQQANNLMQNLGTMHRQIHGRTPKGMAYRTSIENGTAAPHILEIEKRMREMFGE